MVLSKIFGLKSFPPSYIAILLGLTFCLSCNEKEATLFTLTDTSTTGISFLNDLPYTEEFNTYTYRNFYNGGGVALGDVNNDGLIDIFFSGTIVDNKLYLNRGDWKFEDITEKAGVACSGVWSTGATFVDINGDGLLDLYVCKAGKPGGERRYNELFINQGDLTFVEKSKEYGLDITGLSIHAAFFDYDRDGDLDCYILNNSVRSVGGFDLKEGQRNVPDPEGNKFMRNEGGVFKDVTQEVGVYSSNIGYGLGITISDFDQDNWPDLFISNDFFERDYLYLNNQDGTFREVADKSFASLSMGSMGADAADIDNDLLPDLFVTEMLPQSLERKKTKAQYETWDKYTASAKKGYHYQFTRNVLQRNLGKTKFMELSRLAGVAATEWSWASLIQDFDNDGLKDMYISNGIYKDLLDRDYLNYFADDAMIRSEISKNEKVITMLVDSMPSQAVPNYMYKNTGEFQFESVAEVWGLGQKTFSNGSAYGDLDNDGDLDLVVNNVNMPSHIYRNNLDTSKARSIQFRLKGIEKNSQAIGAKIIIKHKKGQAFLENYPSRGFQSSIDSRIHFGLGDVTKIDTAIFIWPDGRQSIKTNLATNQLYEVNQSDANAVVKPYVYQSPGIKQDTSTILFEHKDVGFNLFARERLLVEMSGFDGPAIAIADVNGDGVSDVFCGGGRSQKDVLFVSQNGEESYQIKEESFTEDFRSESVKALFFDVDKDGDQDLYVAKGGKTFSKFEPELHDILYLNDGKGNFTKKDISKSFPGPLYTGDVEVADIDQNGWLDIVVVEKMKTSLFGLPGSVHVLYNQGNTEFKLETPSMLQDFGMFSDVAIMDINQDKFPDLIVAGKWMPISIITNQQGHFSDVNAIEQIPNSSGLWNSLFIHDVDQDGDKDLICGNEGLNNFYESQMQLYIHDFDGNGYKEQILCKNIKGQYFPVHDIDELYGQMPILKKKFLYYHKCATADMVELFGAEQVSLADKMLIDELQSIVLINTGAELKKVSLPSEIQYSSVYSINAAKQPQKPTSQLIIGGNNFRVKPQYGKQDASSGWLVDVKGEGKDSISFKVNKPLGIEGQIRNIQHFSDKIIVGINDERVTIIELPKE